MYVATEQQIIDMHTAMSHDRAHGRQTLCLEVLLLLLVLPDPCFHRDHHGSHRARPELLFPCLMGRHDHHDLHSYQRPCLYLRIPLNSKFRSTRRMYWS